MKRILISMPIAIAMAALLPLFAQETPSKPAKTGVKNVEVAEAAKLLENDKGIVVLDVRREDEYSEGHIAGAKNIDFFGADFQKKLGMLDKSKKYLVHCASGGRSAKARDLMKKMSFESIYHLEGGFMAWEKAGKPVQR